MAENEIYCMKTDGFHGELFRPEQDSYPGKVLICFSGSDGKFGLSRMLAQVFQSHGLTALALAYVMEEGLPSSTMSPSTRWRRRQYGCTTWAMKR